MKRQTFSWLAILLAMSLFTPLFGIESYVGKQIAESKAASRVKRTEKGRVDAAQAFLKSLDAEQRAKVTFPLQDGEWRAWSNLPPNADYLGVPVKEMSEEQLERVFDLLASCLSIKGFEKVKGIMLGDDLLVQPGNRGRMLFGADNYWVNIFGNPEVGKTWGWQFDGHHLGLNVVVKGKDLTFAPSFIGTQPAHFVWGDKVKYAFAPMKREVDLAFALMDSLNSQQKKKAVIGERRQNLEAGPGKDDVVPERAGIQGDELNKGQKKRLIQLFQSWVTLLPPRIATQRVETWTQEINQSNFAWAGETAPHSPVYFRLQSPSFLIEFSNQNLGGNPLEHLHSVYREIGDDYGALEPKK